jgi:Glycosyl transferase family 2
MSTLPISVVVPLSKHRRAFFYRFCLPSIEANKPAEILIEDCEGSAPYKRNLGASKAKQDYLFFCDDDAILGADCLNTMYYAIENEKEGFAYCHYASVVNGEEAHPHGKNFIQYAHPFNLPRLKKHNYIDTMSLLKAEHFPEFDETLQAFQDWDLWLTIASEGVAGQFIDEVLFMKFHLDKGISSDPERQVAARKIIKKKHLL